MKPHCGQSHHESFKEELFSHLPYAVISVALSIVVLSVWNFIGLYSKESHKLFHVFHYLHLLFSGAGVVLIFRKYSSGVISGFVVGFLVPAFFCTLSDSILPFWGGSYLGLHMHYHLCFWDHLGTVTPFLSAGILSGFALGKYGEGRDLFYSRSSHFLHIFISSMASILYFFSFGFEDFYSRLGFVFVYLIGAVLIPCSLADIVVPMSFALIGKRRARK